MENTAFFKNLAAVGRYLTGQGFKIKKSTLYLHYHEGKIRPNRGGVYTAEIVQKYVKMWLSRRLPKAPRQWAYLLAAKIIQLCEADETKLDELALFLAAAFDKPEESRTIKALQRAAARNRRTPDLFPHLGGPEPLTKKPNEPENPVTGFSHSTDGG